jgi:hypothetical protein
MGETVPFRACQIPLSEPRRERLSDVGRCPLEYSPVSSLDFLLLTNERLRPMDKEYTPLVF